MEKTLIYDQFHAAGYRFFGIRGATGGVCDCENEHCKAPLKHPWFRNWQFTPVWSDEQIENMIEGGQLEHGYGVILDGLLVVDVDARNGGVASYENLIEKIPQVAGADFIVKTGSGNGSKHLYFKAPVGIALKQNHEQYPGIDFKHSGYVVGPGSEHVSGARYETLFGSPYDISDAPQALIDLLVMPDFYRAEFNGRTIDVNEQDIAAMLQAVSIECDYDTWIKIGMAVHHATHGAGLDLWDAWTKPSKHYAGIDSLGKHWHSFGKSSNPVTIGTLIHFAKDAGWKPAVTFKPVDYVEPEPDDQGIDIAGVDLLRPPGFVGEVTQWVNEQCRFPREHLAVAASLVSMGNLAGLRYDDAQDDVTLNLFAFCVSGSGTGKESIQQAVNQIHRAAHISAAYHGAIKSEQEIIRNLTRHQAAYYVIDEIGIFLQKISNAKKTGGAAYLEGVIGQLMSVYTKANGYLPISGDMKESVKQSLQNELAAALKILDEGGDNSGAIASKAESIKQSLETIDSGLERPFLSLMGFTTPETFQATVTREQVQNGFFSRAFIVQELETNPARKERFKKQPMHDRMKNTLISICHGAHFDVMSSARVENYQARTSISSDDEAVAMLDRVYSYFHEQGEIFKDTNALEAITRRAYELVSKISAVLAAPSGIRTAEHVRWAFAYINKDVELKKSLAVVNDDDTEGQDQLLNAITGRLTSDHGESIGTLDNRLRRFKRPDIEKALAILEKSGQVVKRTEYRGNKYVTKWYDK